jgi:hypothetical protein
MRRSDRRFPTYTLPSAALVVGIGLFGAASNVLFGSLRQSRAAPPRTEESRLHEPALFARWAANSLDRVTNVAQNGTDLATQEEQRDDRHDCDKGEDEGVLGETLAFLVLGHPLR